MNDERGFVAKHAARLSSSASPLSKSNEVQGIPGVIWPRSRFEERSQDAGNQLEQIGHHIASLLRLILGSAPNRIFGTRRPKSDLQRSKIGYVAVASQPVRSSASDCFTDGWILLDFFNRFLERVDLLLELFLATL